MRFAPVLSPFLPVTQLSSLVPNAEEDHRSLIDEAVRYSSRAQSFREVAQAELDLCRRRFQLFLHVLPTSSSPLVGVTDNSTSATLSHELNRSGPFGRRRSRSRGGRISHYPFRNSMTTGRFQTWNKQNRFDRVPRISIINSFESFGRVTLLLFLLYPSSLREERCINKRFFGRQRSLR